uniref:Protein Jade-3 n=1 Tax=Aceria tosichella TaxID=561515 RepID=A0A6G1S9L6_9ACAR
MPKTKHKGRTTMREPVHVSPKRTRQTSRSNSGCSSEDETTNSLDAVTNHRQKRPRVETIGASSTSSAIFDPLTPSLKLKDSTRIYNFGYRKKPAELFRKDLISAMKMADSEQLNESDYITITDHWKEEWEKGVQVPVNPEGLPSASFRLLADKSQKSAKTQTSEGVKIEPGSQENGDSKQNKNITKQSRSTKDYIKKAHRSNEFLKYELDLIDICWQKLMRQTCLPEIPETVIEDVITELERQCAENMKNNKIGIEFNDGVVCDVCRSPYSEDGNEMIFCDTCNVCVHQACYDIDEIPAGEWYCQPCRELGRVDKACCVLCPNKNGAMKRTPDNHWAHVSCSLWVVSQIDGDHKDNASDIKISKKNKSNKT